MTGPDWLILTGAVVAWAFIADRVLDNPRGDAPMGFAAMIVRIYAVWFHRLRVFGRGNLPRPSSGPLIVVCNHTAGVDPALVAAVCPFEVRWMMAKDMMLPRYQWLWEWLRVIGVDRASKRDTASAREAIRHLESGGVIGVFPEGGIENPPRVLRPFMAGVGLLAIKTGAPVLPIFIDGTPVTPRAWGSLWVRSHSRLTFGPLMRFPRETAPGQVAAEVQRWFQNTSGWPVKASS